MKIDVDQTLKTLEGGELRFDPDTPATLKAVCVNALLTPGPDDQTAPSGSAYVLYSLAQRINGGGVTDLQAGEIDLIKKRIERLYAPMVTGQAWDLLEQAGVPRP